MKKFLSSRLVQALVTSSSPLIVFFIHLFNGQQHKRVGLFIFALMLSSFVFSLVYWIFPRVENENWAASESAARRRPKISHYIFSIVTFLAAFFILFVLPAFGIFF